MNTGQTEEILSLEPRFVSVYGADHSPWVQAVLLGLHEKGIPHKSTTVPPLSLLVISGILMPAAQFEGGCWVHDSERLLVRLGFSTVLKKDRKMMLTTFSSSASQRTESVWEFWHLWSYVRDEHPNQVRRLWNHFWRSFSVFYFFLVICVARGRFGQSSNTKLSKNFMYWEDKLASGNLFLVGDTPDTLDLQLFGMVQMFASIPGRSLRVLQCNPKLPRLREWIERMQRRFSDYTHLYSGPHFEPRFPSPVFSTRTERGFFWLGCLVMWLAFPITLLTTVYFFVRVGMKRLRYYRQSDEVTPLPRR